MIQVFPFYRQKTDDSIAANLSTVNLVVSSGTHTDVVYNQIFMDLKKKQTQKPSRKCPQGMAMINSNALACSFRGKI